MKNLSKRMHNYEAQPNPSLWNRIADVLDESHLQDEFPKKLYTTATPPPPQIWEAIENQLNESETTEARVVVLKNRSFHWLRYAAAIVILGGIAFGIMKFINPGNRDFGIATLQEVFDTSIDQPIPTENQNKVESTNEVNETSVSSITKTAPTTRVRSYPAAYSETTEASPTAYASFTNNEIQEIRNNPLYAYEDHVPDVSQRYILLMTPDGNFIRLSKKLSNLVCCVTGEEQDTACKDKIKAWQQKIADMNMAPSPGNFMDILSLVSSISENEL